MINIDMWHGDDVKSCDKIDIFFNDLKGGYCGNIYKDNKYIGDYTCNNSLEIEETFKHLPIVWY